MTAKQAKSPAFRQVLSGLSDGLVLKPMLEAYLYTQDFRGVKFELEAEDSHALGYGPDGWFHPSSHPLVPARQLYYYLSEPDAQIRERLGYLGVLTVTMGKVMHGFIQECLDDLGVMVTPTRERPEEPATSDPDTMARGHYDGEIQLVMPEPYRKHDRQLFEFKTRSPKAKLIDDLDLDGFIAKHPSYHAQIQEYMRMTGLRVAVVLMMQMGYPWELREYHIPYDAAFAGSVADKYRSVLSAVASRELPPPCCSGLRTEVLACPARTVCPVALQ